MFSVILNLEDNPSSEYVTVVEPGEDFLESTFEHSGEFNILSVDPLVRCRECKYWKANDDIEGLMFCSYVIGAEFVRNENDYCSRGERKDDE